MALEPRLKTVAAAINAIFKSVDGPGAMRVVNHTLELKVLPSDRIAGSAISVAVAIQGFALGSTSSFMFSPEERLRVMNLLRASADLLEGTMV